MKKLCIILGVIIIALLTTACGSNTPKSVAEKSVKCLIDEDYEGYVDLVYLDMESGNDQQTENDKKALAGLLKEKASREYEKHKGIESFETLGEEISGDGKTAIVKMKLAYGNGTSDENDIKLRKDKDDNWKIDIGK